MMAKMFRMLVRAGLGSCLVLFIALATSEQRAQHFLAADVYALGIVAGLIFGWE